MGGVCRSAAYLPTLHAGGRGQPGASGSPILNADGQVAGLYAWGWSRPNEGNDSSRGAGMSADVLHHPCGEVRL